MISAHVSYPATSDWVTQLINDLFTFVQTVDNFQFCIPSSVLSVPKSLQTVDNFHSCIHCSVLSVPNSLLIDLNPARALARVPCRSVSCTCSKDFRKFHFFHFWNVNLFPKRYRVESFHWMTQDSIYWK